jgi:hypothetical protein
MLGLSKISRASLPTQQVGRLHVLAGHWCDRALVHAWQALDELHAGPAIDQIVDLIESSVPGGSKR